MGLIFVYAIRINRWGSASYRRWSKLNNISNIKSLTTKKKEERSDRTYLGRMSLVRKLAKRRFRWQGILSWLAFWRCLLGFSRFFLRHRRSFSFLSFLDPLFFVASCIRDKHIARYGQHIYLKRKRGRKVLLWEDLTLILCRFIFLFLSWRAFSHQASFCIPLRLSAMSNSIHTTSLEVIQK